MQRHVVRRTESHFEAPDGRSLFRRAWLSPDPRRVLVLVHGLADHSGRYDHLGAWFATHHYAVHGFDLRGHGRSDGERCHVDRFDVFVDDLEALVERVRGEHPGQPLYLLGHSVGGLIVTRLLCERRPEIDGAVVSAGAFVLGAQPSAAELFGARLLRRLRPRATLPTRVDPAALCRDPRVVEAYRADPLVPERLTVSLALELLAASRRTAQLGDRVSAPLLLLHGDMDSICLPRGARTFYNQMRAPGSRLLVYPKLRHEILNEPEHEQVFEDIHSWILERET